MPQGLMFENVLFPIYEKMTLQGKNDMVSN